MDGSVMIDICSYGSVEDIRTAFTNHVDEVVLMVVTTAKQHRVSLMIWHSWICGACDRWVGLALERDSAEQEAL